MTFLIMKHEFLGLAHRPVVSVAESVAAVPGAGHTRMPLRPRMSGGLAPNKTGRLERLRTTGTR